MQKVFFTIFSIIIFVNAGVAQQKDAYPVIVSFNSVCCGVPSNVPVMKLIKSFKKQYKIKKLYVDSIGPMGREGEYYLAFYLKELNKTQKMKFVEQLKKTVATMTDKGSAEIRENEIINKADLSSRASVTLLKL